MGLPEQSPQLSLETIEDIPEAVREASETETSTIVKQKRNLLVGGLAGLGIITILTLLTGLFLTRLPSQSQVNASTTEIPENEPLQASTPNQNPDTENTDNLLGHLRYQQASPRELIAISVDGRFRLRQAAAQKFLEMQAAARADGINLTVISAFRSIEEQQDLFFKVKEERGQLATKRAEVSAPPGYSEHHTGYALDLGDGNVPATNLNTTFESTPAFRWLEKNAAYYSFELSFPPDNPQGINYEPWHWRFVGDQGSLETFYKAKQLPKTNDN